MYLPQSQAYNQSAIFFHLPLDFLWKSKKETFSTCYLLLYAIRNELRYQMNNARETFTPPSIHHPHFWSSTEPRTRSTSQSYTENRSTLDPCRHDSTTPGSFPPRYSRTGSCWVPPHSSW